jgi:hypothetical protein
MDDVGDPQSELQIGRLKSVLDELAKRGISQAQVAAGVGVTRQYLNDVVYSRRPLSELLARRIGEQFQVDFQWLLGRQSMPAKTATTGVGDTGVWLPVLPHPVEGNPRMHPRWEGTFLPVPPIALPTLAMAVDPYVLRFLQNDVERRLHKNDLVLVSQTPDEIASIVVVRAGKKCFLARRKGRDWVRLANGDVLDGDLPVVGHCIGVLWSSLT